jgi:hypothetical protein
VATHREYTSNRVHLGWRSWLPDRGHELIDQWARILKAEDRGESENDRIRRPSYRMVAEPSEAARWFEPSSPTMSVARQWKLGQDVSCKLSRHRDETITPRDTS